ncbi:carbon-monoxide dehydrogenase medium subunit [Albidovulum inexpectatum]|uniref:Carbon-monoxide dehydrogenase medium subunit n=1 Tax=Albidovulum inexpectatum TaxID=196587 RepID=A0A2S5JM02_9RHOB|nr:xanthine dehydrogenase family protein subunit M [Albidovulum inexpectatum]PPB82275.1 carbon-monoxide dehydrogenase medium subunit [Albidovulum inexpectatum]
MRYLAPRTADDAVAALLAEKGPTRILAGGTDVLVQMRSGAVEPDLIVDIKRIPGLDRITREDGGWRIGAAVPNAALGEDRDLRASWAGVVEAANLIGSTQVQGRATMVGNLCNGSPAADSVPALVAAEAVARIHGPDGTRDCPVAEIPAGPGKTTLKKGEIVTSLFLPARPRRSGDAYLRFIPRTEMDIAVASAAVSVELDAHGRIVRARVALGAVAPTVLVAEEAAAILTGTQGEDDVLERMAEACRAICRPIDDKRGTVEFRRSVAGTLAKRAARIALQRAGGQS